VFIELTHIKGSPTAANLIELVKKLTQQTAGLEAKHLARIVSVGTDGASVMTGEHSGMQQRIQQEMAPHSLGFHCAAHRTQLCAAVAKNNALVANALAFLSAFSAHFSKSSPRRDALSELADRYDLIFRRPLRIVATRWLSSLPPMERCVGCWVLYALYTSDVPEISYMHNNLTDARYMVTMHGLVPLLRQLRRVIKASQVADMYLGDLLHELEEVRANIKGMYIDETDTKFYSPIYFPELTNLLDVGTNASILSYNAEHTLVMVAPLAAPGSGSTSMHVQAAAPPKGQRGRPSSRLQPLYDPVELDDDDDDRLTLSIIADYVKGELTSTATDVLTDPEFLRRVLAFWDLPKDATPEQAAAHRRRLGKTCLDHLNALINHFGRPSKTRPRGEGEEGERVEALIDASWCSCPTLWTRSASGWTGPRRWWRWGRWGRQLPLKTRGWCWWRAATTTRAASGSRRARRATTSTACAAMTAASGSRWGRRRASLRRRRSRGGRLGRPRRSASGATRRAAPWAAALASGSCSLSSLWCRGRWRRSGCSRL
jgi:hypothetical protein